MWGVVEQPMLDAADPPSRLAVQQIRCRVGLSSHVHVGQSDRAFVATDRRQRAARGRHERLGLFLVRGRVHAGGGGDDFGHRSVLYADADTALLHAREPMKSLRALLKDRRRSQQGSVLGGVLIITAFLAILSGALMTELSTNFLLSTDLVNRVNTEATVSSAAAMYINQLQSTQL